MMPSEKNLADIRKELKGAIQAKIQEAMKTGTLTEAKTLLYGSKANVTKLSTAAVWIVPEAHIPDVSAARRAWHNFNFDFAAVVKDIDPEKGADRAEDLAAKIYDVIMADRSLGGLVHDITPTSVEPAYEAGVNQLHWAAVSFSFKIPRVE
jgi:hypothetical protein